MYLYKPVPKLTSNENWKEVLVSDNKEKLVLVDPTDTSYNASLEVELESSNHKDCVDIYVRESILEKLKVASLKLPENYSFHILDAYRIIDEKNAVEEKQSRMHMTGGTIDVSVIGADGKLLDMGTDYNDSSEKARIRYYEELMPKGIFLTEEELNILNNRRLLFNVLTRSGFVNYESKWWQFDYGNQFWGVVKSKDAIYALIESDN